MKLKIEIPTNCLIVSVENAGPFIAALSSMTAVRESGYGKDRKWETADTGISVEVVPDEFAADKPEPLKKALENYETAQSNWLGEYTKRAEAEKKVKELQAKLDEITDAMAPTQQPA